MPFLVRMMTVTMMTTMRFALVWFIITTCYVSPSHLAAPSEPNKQATSDKSDGSDSDDSDSSESGSDDDASGKQANKRGRLQKGSRAKKAGGGKKTGQQQGSDAKKGKRKLKRKASSDSDSGDDDDVSVPKRAKSGKFRLVLVRLTCCHLLSFVILHACRIFTCRIFSP